MDNLIQMLVALVILVFSLIVSNSRRRKAQQQNAERRIEEDTLAEGDGDTAPPPFMEDFPFATELEQAMSQADEDETEAVPEAPEEPAEPADPEEPTQPVEKPRPEPPPVPVESPTGVRSLPATALLDLTPQTFRQGIILKEILDRPKTRRTRRS